MDSKPTLGTLLRRLLEALDGAVERSYAEAGLDYRPRYTPVVRALIENGPTTIRELSQRTGVTHSATGQTVNQMAKQGMVTLTTGDDARERIVALTPYAHTLVPQLKRHWAATEAAARTLDSELGLSLPDTIDRALDLLDRTSFDARLKAASATNPD